MRKIKLSLVLMLGLTFAASAHTSKMQMATTIQVEEDTCAEWAGAMIDWLGADVTTPSGLALFYALLDWCNDPNRNNQQ